MEWVVASWVRLGGRWEDGEVEGEEEDGGIGGCGDWKRVVVEEALRRLGGGADIPGEDRSTECLLLD